MRNFFLFLLFLTFGSCSEGLDYVSINDKYYINDNGVGNFLSPKNSQSVRSTIYPSIIDYNYDTDYIVAIQKVRDLKASNLGFDLYYQFKMYSKYREDSSYYNEFKYRKDDMLYKDSLIYEVFKSKGATTENTSEDIRIREWVADSLITNAPYYKKIFSNDTNYWIIQIANDSLIGPLTKSEFEVTRKEMNIPNKLKLD